METVGEPGRATTRTLLRGLDLLERIGEATDGATVTDLANATGLDKGTVSRLLATLRDAGWANQAPDDRRYRLAGKALALSHGYTNRVDLRTLSLPILAKLRDISGETVHLGTIEGSQVVYVERLEPSVPVRVVSNVGQRLPIACTAMGKAYLAALPEVDLLPTVEGLPIPRMTEHTIVERSALLEAVRLTRKRGYATDVEENHLEVMCVGAAVTDVTRSPIATISISGPSYRMKRKMADLGKACSEAALTISQALGDAQQG